MSEVRPFQLLVKPVSADCNQRCAYCFYLRTHSLYAHQKVHRMSDEILEQMISGMLRLRFPETVFAWQGGEPTLAGVDFFRRVVDLQERHGVSGQVVGNGLQTNGLLLDEEWCQLFKEYKFLIGLSIDGPEAVHNKLRYDASGRGCWDKAMAAARLMDQHEVPYNILCVVNSENVKLGNDLLRWFVDHGFHYLQFIPCQERGMEYNVSAEAYGDFLCESFDYWAREGFGRVSIRDFDALLAARMGQNAALCTFGRVCNHYIVIEHNGDVYPCDFFVYDEWRLGNLIDAPIESFVETERYKQFAYQKDKVAACRGCPWRALCHGGCPKDRLAAGSITDPTPFCAAYRHLFAHAAPRLPALATRAQGFRACKRVRRQHPQTRPRAQR